MARGTPIRRRSGFTLVELVMTMIIIGVLAVFVLPRFTNQLSFQTRGFVDQTLAALQYARKIAVATGRNVCVIAGSGGNTLSMTMASARGQSNSCTDVVSNPAAKWQTYSSVAYGSALSTTFRADGSASAGASLTVSGDRTYTIAVESTGYVHCSPVTACE
jgi:MSHA pilin protein MshC